jgi:hypothetical protein
MILGSVIADRDQRLFVVLAARLNYVAVVPLRFVRARGEKRMAGDVDIDAGDLGHATALCGKASLMEAGYNATGYVIPSEALRACQRAVERIQAEKSLDRFRPLAAFAAAVPSFRSGGRRVGGKVGSA